MLPCMLRPAWLAHSGAGAAASHPSGPQQAAPAPAVVVSAASGAGQMLAADPASAAAASGKHTLFYSLVTLSTAPRAFPSAPPLVAPDHLPHQQSQQQQQQQRQEHGHGQLFLTCLALSADGCPVTGGGPAVQCWEAPAGLAVEPLGEAVTAACLVPPQQQGVPYLALATSTSQLHLLALPASWAGLWGDTVSPAAVGADAPRLSGTAQQAKQHLEVQLSAPARQLHFLPGAGTTSGTSIAAQGGRSCIVSSTSCDWC